MSVIDYANIQIDTLLLLAADMPKSDKLRLAMLERADELIERVHQQEQENYGPNTTPEMATT